MPGSVAVLSLVGRFIRIVREVGSIAGNKPPMLSGGFDHYMNDVLFRAGASQASMGADEKPTVDLYQGNPAVDFSFQQHLWAVITGNLEWIFEIWQW